MKTTQFFVAAACAFFLSATAFAQTTPSGTMQNGTSTGTMQNGTTGTMQNGTTGTMQNGTTGTMQNGTSGDRMQGGMNNGTMDSKSKMNGRKSMKKTKTSSTKPSSTGTM
ncbi:MAG: hypothetical protein EOO56_10680 [Hymenobacter sp.]|nr:MAG: hypothetical protein EOO56_10680 [Hymenobacter sp.]